MIRGDIKITNKGQSKFAGKPTQLLHILIHKSTEVCQKLPTVHKKTVNCTGKNSLIDVVTCTENRYTFSVYLYQIMLHCISSISFI